MSDSGIVESFDEFSFGFWGSPEERSSAGDIEFIDDESVVFGCSCDGDVFEAEFFGGISMLIDDNRTGSEAEDISSFETFHGVNGTDSDGGISDFSDSVTFDGDIEQERHVDFPFAGLCPCDEFRSGSPFGELEQVEFWSG
jgi:hypothetical protein